MAVARPDTKAPTVRKRIFRSTLYFRPPRSLPQKPSCIRDPTLSARADNAFAICLEFLKKVKKKTGKRELRSRQIGIFFLSLAETE